MSAEEIASLEREIFEMGQRLHAMRAAETGTEVANYSFDTLDGKVTLRELFAGHDKLLAIHNMGQGCRYCTLWADGLNPFVEHLESTMAVVLLSKDEPGLQRRFANSRGWRFRTASHGGGHYMQEQVASGEYANMPGAVAYELRDDRIYRKNSCLFGPGDLYCSIWHLLSLVGVDEAEWTPQYNYWRRPQQLDDGGENILD